jgi:hypothetical protein
MIDKLKLENDKYKLDIQKIRKQNEDNINTYNQLSQTNNIIEEKYNIKEKEQEKEQEEYQ